MSSSFKVCSMRMPADFKPPDMTKNGLKYSAVFLRGLTWEPKQTVRIGFMDEGRPNGVTYDPVFLDNGDPLEREIQFMSPMDMVRTVVRKRIQPFVDLKLVFVPDPSDAHIRISFSGQEEGAWSYVGNTSVYDLQSHEPSLNLGWLNTVVIVHEIMHGLGMGHEHQNPQNGLEWDREVVLKWARDTQRWDTPTTELNILEKLEKGAVTGSEFDSKSIMLYSFPLEFTKCKCVEMPWNKVLSLKDAEWLVKMYKQGADYRKIYATVYGYPTPSVVEKGAAKDKASVEKGVADPAVSVEKGAADPAASVAERRVAVSQGSTTTSGSSMSFALVVILLFIFLAMK
jgi:hypothetical protein